MEDLVWDLEEVGLRNWLKMDIKVCWDLKNFGPLWLGAGLMLMGLGVLRLMLPVVASPRASSRFVLHHGPKTLSQIHPKPTQAQKTHTLSPRH